MLRSINKEQLKAITAIVESRSTVYLPNSISIELPDVKMIDMINQSRDYTDAKIANLVGIAPESLDTLEEIAAWIQDDNSGAAKIVADVAELQRGKVSSLGVPNRLYGTNSSGGNRGFAVGSSMQAGEVPMRNENGNIQTNGPIYDLDCANKQYVDSNFLPLNKTDLWAVYTTGGTAGTQRMVRLDSNGSSANTIPQKTLNNTIKANGTPTEDNELTPKKYVDTALKNKVNKVTPTDKAFVYGADPFNQGQGTYILDSDGSSLELGSIPVYWSDSEGSYVNQNGGFLISKHPVNEYHVATKKYVDDAVSNSGGGSGGGSLYRHTLSIDGEDTINSIFYQWKYSFLSSKSTQYTMADYILLTQTLLKGMVAQFWKYDTDDHYGLGWINNDNFSAFTLSGHEIIPSGNMDAMYINDTVAEA